MEDIVAIALELEGGGRRFFLTWGRIQDTVDPAPLEQLILQHSVNFDLGGKPIKARMCWSLQEAAHEPYFYEALFSFSQKPIPFGVGDQYPAWKLEMHKKMQSGQELYYLGNPDRCTQKM